MDVASAPFLSFCRVSKVFTDDRYRKVEALTDISLEICQREFVSLIGPSGCGKSTLLRLAAGLETASTGSVLYRGQEVAGPEPERGLVFQSYNAFPWLTVRDNVSFGLRQNGGQAHERSEKVDRWLNFMGLSEFADAYPKTLSGGMRQRLAIARAMIVQPRLLLLDEPFGALDERTRDQMQQLLLKIVRDSDCTVLLVTHDIREAILLADRVVVLQARPGRIGAVVPSRLQKPRQRDQLKTPAFNALYEEVVNLFPS